MSEQRLVLILDLYAREDGFVGDGGVSGVAKRLSRDGHAVTWIRSHRDSHPDGPDAWIASIRDEVIRRRPDLIVLPRAWDRNVPDAVRAAMLPHAELVRLASGIAAGIDAVFDRVLDATRLEALAHGAEPAPEPLWRPLRPSELRALPVIRDDLPELVPIDLTGRGALLRPILSGPATGCPFLLDTRKNPEFARAGLDASVTQTRGCSFCLDNHGAYALPDEGAVIDAWLGRWRTLRAGDPQLREVLLVDERPHPFLPRFFEAIAAEPGLHGIELLFKSRVDWLLEFEAELVEALESARRSRSCLHAYLVGFESFDQFHLDLFNKGVRVEDNVRAMQKLRELGRRFPDSFEYRKYRAHGIVLFTPWTTPEALLENARWLRALDFHEFRSEALRTRLRLYPRTPLFALARADGLLVEEFGARGDRAVEQGYDASVPWRFRDRRTETIERVALALATTERADDDAYLLELATRFVVRWPGLEQTGEDAAIPLRYSELRGALGRGADRIGPLAAGFDPELELIRMGVKRAALKEGVLAGDAPRLVNAYRSAGLFAEVVGRFGFDKTRGIETPGNEMATVAVAGSGGDLDEVLALQRAHREGAPAPVEEMGALMGYPPCCVQAFREQAQRGDNLENERLSVLRAPRDPYEPLIQRLGRVRLLGHHLCSPACRASTDLARTILDRIEALEPESAVWIRECLSRPLLVLDYDRRFELAGAWHDDVFRVETLTPIGRASLPFAVAELETLGLDPRNVSFGLRNGKRHVVPAVRPLLIVPGEPLARAALDALASARYERSMPDLPSAIRPGAVVGTHTLASVREQEDGYEVVLTSLGVHARLRIRPNDRTRPATLRTSAWDVEIDRPESLGEETRTAIRALVAALLVSARANPTSSKRPSRVR